MNRSDVCWSGSCFVSSSGHHVRSTQRWTRFYQRVSHAERKLLWRDSRSTISSRRRQRQGSHRSRACTVKSCCSAAPPNSALRNCELNATSKRWHRSHRRSQVKRIKLVPLLKSDTSNNTLIIAFFYGLSPWILTLSMLFCKYFCLRRPSCSERSKDRRGWDL